MKGGKAPTAIQKRWQEWQRVRGCAMCRWEGIESPAETHHAIGSAARSEKTNVGQWHTCGLCAHHHRIGPLAIHQLPNRRELEKKIFNDDVYAYRSEGKAFPEEVRRLVMGYHV